MADSKEAPDLFGFSCDIFKIAHDEQYGENPSAALGAIMDVCRGAFDQFAFGVSAPESSLTESSIESVQAGDLGSVKGTPDTDKPSSDAITHASLEARVVELETALRNIRALINKVNRLAFAGGISQSDQILTFVDSAIGKPSLLRDDSEGVQ